MIPFVLLSMNRSGSYHLAALLDRHPDIVCNGEVLNPTSQDVWRYERGVAAVGAKVMDTHLASFPQVLPALQSCPVMHYIVLERRNQFEALRSLVQVEQGGYWQRQSGDLCVQPIAHLDLERCRQRIADAEEFYTRLRTELPASSTAWVYYEDLLTDQDSILGTLWEFLHVPPPGPLTSPLQRQETRPLSETVCNYDELQEAFIGTPYERFLS